MGGILSNPVSNFGSGVIKTVGGYLPTVVESLALGAGGQIQQPNEISLFPFSVPFSFYTNEVSFSVSVAAAAGGVTDVLVYGSDPITNLPYDLMGSANGIAVDSVGVKTGALPDLNFVSGLIYWVGVCPSLLFRIYAGYGRQITAFNNDPLAGMAGITNANVYGTRPAFWGYGSGTLDTATLTDLFKLKIVG